MTTLAIWSKCFDSTQDQNELTGPNRSKFFQICLNVQSKLINALELKTNRVNTLFI